MNELILKNEDVLKIEKIIGYTFRDKKILQRALTHSSCAVNREDSYQILEFLGDSVLNFVIADELVKRYPDFNEGQLTRFRAAVVSDRPLAATVSKLKLNAFLFMGESEKRMKINKNHSVMEDMYEAIVGGIYTDGGLDAAREFIFKTLGGVIEKNEDDPDGFRDFKSLINEYATKSSKNVSYVDLTDYSRGIPPKSFKFSLIFDGEAISDGSGKSKKEAQQKAAESALKKIRAK